jgi:hypothetical protein
MAAAVMLLASCGGGSAKVTAQPPRATKTTTTTMPPAAPNTPKQRVADTAVAKQAVLELSDLPFGWAANPHNNSGPDLPKSVETKFLACAHLPKRFIDNANDNQPNADSPDFTKGTVGAGPAAEVDSSVEVDRAVSDVSEPLSHFADPGTAKCFDPLFRAEFALALRGDTGVSLHGFALRALSVGTVGDQAAGFQGRVTITGPKASIPIEFDLYFVRKGRGIAMLTAVAFSVPFDQAFAQSLLQKMVGRLSAVG